MPSNKPPALQQRARRPTARSPTPRARADEHPSQRHQLSPEAALAAQLVIHPRTALSVADIQTTGVAEDLLIAFAYNGWIAYLNLTTVQVTTTGRRCLAAYYDATVRPRPGRTRASTTQQPARRRTGRPPATTPAITIWPDTSITLTPEMLDRLIAG